MLFRNYWEKFAEWIFIRFAGIFTIVLLFGIFLYVLVEALPFFGDFTIGEFFAGKKFISFL